jgi:uncharacterized protein (DUF2252 family)
VPELVPIRYGRMLASPFTFFRGAAAIMAADLAPAAVSGLKVQLCGDAHLSNFGGFAAPDRRLVFDVNDFDETLPGPWEWDVMRMATSFSVAGRALRMTRGQRRDIVLTSARAYRRAMRRFAQMPTLDVWYARTDLEGLLARPPRRVSASQRRSFAGNLAKARAKGSARALAKLTHRVDGRLRFISAPPLLTPIEELLPPDDGREVTEAVLELLSAYRATLPADRGRLLDGYRFAHLARKVVGVGSVGTRAWVVLLIGRDTKDPLVLQVKEAEASVLEDHLEPAGFDNHGQRVVEGQRMMQAAGDIFLGWLRATGNDDVERDFYVRQLWDGKGSAAVEEMDPAVLELYARMCGRTLARGHARSGDRAAIAAYLGGGQAFDRAMAEFAERYADQNERDYATVRAAVDAGAIEAREDL